MNAIRLTGGLVCLALFGCTIVKIPHNNDRSYEHLTINYESGKNEEPAKPTPSPSKPKLTVAPADSVPQQSTLAGSDSITCGLYNMPKRQPTPAMPEFTDAEAKDPEKINDKLGDYIIALRNYLRERSKEDDEAYQEYRKSCKDQNNADKVPSGVPPAVSFP
jgi:hypothetical protein